MGLQGVCRAGNARGSRYRGMMLLNGASSLQPQPVPARWAPHGHRAGVATLCAAGCWRCSSLRLPDSTQSWKSPTAADARAGSDLQHCSSPHPQGESDSAGLRLQGGCERRGGFGKPNQGGCWSPREVTAPGMDWGHSSCHPLNFGVEQQGKQEPREDHNHGFICYDPTVQLID